MIRSSEFRLQSSVLGGEGGERSDEIRIEAIGHDQACKGVSFRAETRTADRGGEWASYAEESRRVRGHFVDGRDDEDDGG